MKTLAYFVSIALAGTTFLTACDTIENPIPKAFDQLTAAEGRELDSLETKNGIKPAVQKVLLEDYTGHQCGNCPSAALKAREQQAIYGDRLVVMAVHAGFFAKVNTDPSVTKFKTNWTTPEGETWNEDFKVVSYPAGMINRVPKAGSSGRAQGIATWSAAISAQMAKAPQIRMTLTTVYVPDTRKVNIKVRSEYLAASNGKYNLGVYITEDSVVNWQKNYGSSSGGDPAYPVGDVENYVHPHAMRVALNGTWGQTNKENPVIGDVVESYFTTKLDPAWRAKKCSVVAFIYDAATNEVVQVEEQHLEVH